MNTPNDAEKRDTTLTIREMYGYQQRLQARYAEQWGEPIEPQSAVRKLCWAYGEMAEAGDIIKKKGNDAIMHDPEERRHFMEEMGDVMMYMYDVLLCYGMTPEEFSDIYRAKCERNAHRWD